MTKKARIELLVRIGAVASVTVFIASSALCYAAQTAEHDNVPQETITFTLPVYVSSLIAAVGFTWAVARYSAKREQVAERLEYQVDALQRELENMRSSKGVKNHKEHP